MLYLTKIQAHLDALKSNMLSFAYMLTGNRQDAHALIRNSISSILDNNDCKAGRNDFKAYVFATMRSIVSSENYRNRAFRPRTDDGISCSSHLSQDSEPDNPEGTISFYELSEYIRSLSESIRRPFAMLVAGYQNNEIAKMLNLPRSVVRRRISAAAMVLQPRFAEPVEKQPRLPGSLKI